MFNIVTATAILKNDASMILWQNLSEKKDITECVPQEAFGGHDIFVCIYL